MDQEVAKTLGELELKLTELERELTSIGHPNPPSEPVQRPPGRLVDEAIEPSDGRGDRQYPPPAPYSPSQQAPIEQHPPVDIAALVRFRDKLGRTMDELIDEYSRLLSPKPGDTQRPPDA